MIVMIMIYLVNWYNRRESNMKSFFLTLVFASSLFAQVEYSQNPTDGQMVPKFFIELASYASPDSGMTKIDVFIKVPYSNVQFLRDQISYKADYSLIISIYDDDDVLKLEKIWNERVTAQNFDQTVSRASFNISYKSFSLQPGEYNFICKLEDNESRKYAKFERTINIREFNENFDVSDIVLASGFVDTEEGPKIIPNISNQITSKDSSISFFYEVYSKDEQDISASYIIFNEEEEILFLLDTLITLASGKNEFNETLDDASFSLGGYILEVRVRESDQSTAKAVRKNFSSQLFGFPASIRDLDLAIKQMQYYASPSEIEEIEDTEEYDEKLNKFVAYWKSQDPSPNSVENERLNEYYRRVEYANANFKGYFNGWRSDMGMVYITLGAPDQVTRRPYEMDSKPYEVWDYYIINRRFVFVDQTNFGDYRLMNPAYGDWFRYRP